MHIYENLPIKNIAHKQATLVSLPYLREISSIPPYILISYIIFYKLIKNIQIFLDDFNIHQVIIKILWNK